MILVVTNKEDVHPTPVIEYLTSKGHPVFRLNTEALLSDYDFTWNCTQDGIDFSITNVKTGLCARSCDIGAVWERRPVLPSELRITNREEINRHNLAEAGGFFSFLLYWLGSRYSIGHHLYDRSAASKILQLDVARQLGMRVPSTCFSNCKADIINFAQACGCVAIKSIENDNVWLGGEDEYVFYSQKAEPQDIAASSEEAFTQTVSFVQDYVDKAFELRVTVVDGEAFACKIDSQAMDEDKGKTDWRQGLDHGIRHEVFPLPDRVTAFCNKFLKRMHLNFGCFDFIVTPSGEYVFLECNPNGQWLWVEIETGMNISQAIAECLIRHDKQTTT